MSTPESDPPASAFPVDEHDRQLIDLVHPPKWVNPEPRERYHLVVVGGGTAGLVAAAGAAGLGARVALVERHLLGGDCLNVGCVPSKGVISAARAWHRVEAGPRFGAPSAAGPGDFGAAMRRMRRLRAGIAPHDGALRFRELGVDVFLGEGRFVASDAVEVGGRRLRFRYGVVATGGRATAPPIPGLAEAGYVTNETIFALTELPPRLAVIGGGPIGCELAQAFARFGATVTVLDVAPYVLPREDRDAAELVQAAMRRDGVRLELGVEVTGVRTAGDGRRVAYRREGGAGEVAVDQILVAVGRTANVEGLGLEAAGVAFDQGGVRVDDHLRTTNRRVFACGDVASPFKFTHAADAQARIVLTNSLFPGRSRVSRLVIPWCTYTSPEIAHVGLYEEEARQRGLDVDSITVPMADVDRAVLDGEGEGFLRIHHRRGRDRILGATLVAEHAGDMIGELCLAITHRIGLKKLASTIHPYPTQGEVVKKAADAWMRTRLTPTAKRLIGWWLKVG